MKPGDEYKIIEIAVAVKIHDKSCKGCIFVECGETATSDYKDPCRVCDANFIFEKRYKLERIN